MDFFKLTKNTIIITENMEITKPLLSGIVRMKRDMDRVLSDRILSDRILSDRILSDQVLSGQELSNPKFSDRELSDRVFSNPEFSDLARSGSALSDSEASKDSTDVPDKGSRIVLKKAPLKEEEYRIHFHKKEKEQELSNSWDMVIQAGSDLGFLYALLHISEEYLDITPFWFFNDQKIVRKSHVLIPVKEIHSPIYKVRYRGWFINDEVLLINWKVDGDNGIVWEMAFEALLRLGGNTVIPGTDKNSRVHRQQAADMGLWISHHHAEPLGAEMFSRAYPELMASYDSHPDKFTGLWKQGIEEQKDMKVIWNLGFRGQGDCPFWTTDPKYSTPEARGKLISEVMEKQAALVREQVEEPVFCTNLYGEIMELYLQGHISLPENTIRVRADNGYGKMVSRRQDLHNPRVPALPDEKEQEKGYLQGIYYHVSFYDLQAANHITMLPNSLEFLRDELKTAFSSKVDSFLIVNCSNIKPHVYFLEAVAELWKTGDLETDDYKEKYIEKYYKEALDSASPERREELKKAMIGCFDGYAQAAVPYGEREDEHAGEQFYTYMTRGFYSKWMKGRTEGCVKSLSWATGELPFPEQIEWYLKKCQDGLLKFTALYEECERIADSLKDPELWRDSITLQTGLHLHCLRGAVAFCRAFQSFAEKNYKDAFYLTGTAARHYREADALLRSREHDKWQGFYANECLSDIKLTAYLLKHLMAHIRNMGEGPYFFHWQRELLYSETDRKVMLITNFENHPTDEELFEYMDRQKRD